MHARRFGSITRADVQAALLSCALVASASACVLCACTCLPACAALPASLGIIAVFCAAAVVGSVALFRNISNPSRWDLYHTDRLTGLKSRNAFETDLQNIHAGNSWRSSGLLLVDLDHLKAVNDALGHTVGDAYLRLAADALRKGCGGEHAPYRVGGDEFAVLVCGGTAETLQALETRVLNHFDQNRPDWKIPTSLSVGWAVFDGGCDRNLYDTYHRADGQMYACKRANR